MFHKTSFDLKLKKVCSTLIYVLCKEIRKKYNIVKTIPGYQSKWSH